MKIFVPLHPLNNVKIINYFKYKTRFHGVFSINNLSTIKYVINLDDKSSKGTHWVSLFIDRNTAVYFDSFGIEYIPPEMLNKIQDRSGTHNIFSIQDKESVLFGLYCITFIE